MQQERINELPYAFWQLQLRICARLFVEVQLENSCHRRQNRRQKVVNREALRLCGGGLRSGRVGLTFKIDKNSTDL